MKSLAKEAWKGLVDRIRERGVRGTLSELRTMVVEQWRESRGPSRDDLIVEIERLHENVARGDLAYAELAAQRDAIAAELEALRAPKHSVEGLLSHGLAYGGRDDGWRVVLDDEAMAPVDSIDGLLGRLQPEVDIRPPAEARVRIELVVLPSLPSGEEPAPSEGEAP